MTSEDRIQKIDELLARSSLSTEGIDQLCARTSTDTLAAILRRKGAEEVLDRLDEAFGGEDRAEAEPERVAPECPTAQS